jgi:pimeloyl-ACP methyl ester carboxylesterase
MLLAGCASFRRLNSDLAFMDETYIVSATVENATEFQNIYGAVVEWDQAQRKVLSADFARVGPLGVFAFFVKSARNQHVLAFSDLNRNEGYDPGEPAWIHSKADGRAAPAAIPAKERKVGLRGKLSKTVALPPEMLTAAKAFRGARTPEQAATGWDIPIALGDIANLDDPRFSAVRGEEGLWEPARFPRETGIGIYFLEKYDPGRIPVLFVYGAGGSPQDWREFFKTMDRTQYQPWFLLYPTGRRLEGTAMSLNDGVELLHEHLGFKKLYVVAHSMGGLVSRSFLIHNILIDGNRYVVRFVSISTPWAGHEAAAMGVKFSPGVVPSWRDMAKGSAFQKEIFSRSLKGRVDHLLLFGTRPSRSIVLPHENDGTVSVESQCAPAAVEDAVRTVGFDADHVGILSRPEVIHAVEAFLSSTR